jgi:hypothetical protein
VRTSNILNQPSAFQKNAVLCILYIWQQEVLDCWDEKRRQHASLSLDQIERMSDSIKDNILISL